MTAPQLWVCDAAAELSKGSLSRAERARAGAMRDPARRHAFEGGRVLARAALTALRPEVPEDGWCFAERPSGRPEPVGDAARGLDVSIAHSGRWVCVAAISGGRVGIDVEDTQRRVAADALIRRYFAPSEQEWLARLDENERISLFFDVWTLKEAVVKREGGALATEIARVVVNPLPQAQTPPPVRVCRAPPGLVPRSAVGLRGPAGLSVGHWAVGDALICAVWL